MKHMLFARQGGERAGVREVNILVSSSFFVFLHFSFANTGSWNGAIKICVENMLISFLHM